MNSCRIKLLLTFSFLIFLSSFAAPKSKTSPKKPKHQKIDNQTELRFNLDQLIKSIEDSINSRGNVIIPENATEFEKLLFRARRTQHNDSQLVAIKQFRYLLEFEQYRSEGEKQYIELLLANSLDYVGSPLIAYSYLNILFPDFIQKIESNRLKSFFLSHYAGILVQIDSLERAKEIYQKVIQLSRKENDTSKLYSARNDYGYVLKRLKQYDSSMYYFKLNQNISYRKFNPILHAFSFGNYGNVLFEKKEYDSTIFYSKKEIKLLNEIHSSVGLGKAHAIVGKAFFELNQYDSAKFHFNEALQYNTKTNSYTKTNNLYQVISNYESLLTLYSVESNQPVLQGLLKRYFHSNDSLKRLLSHKTYEDELKIAKFMEIINETSESKKIHDQLQRSNRELLYIISGLSFLITILILVLLYRRKNRKTLTLTNEQLNQKNKELNKSYLIISESNEKNEILLKELHHRVKNNLQMISSLFNLQLNALELDSSAAQVFKKAQDRIFSIALVHRKIYQSDQVEKMEFRDYLKDFTDELTKSHATEVKVEINLKPTLLSVDSAIPLGLIFNELFTNSLKHANADKILEVNIIQDEGNRKFIYYDNGVGINPELIDHENTTSIGLILIDLLSKQLDATVEFKSPQKGSFGFYFSIEGNFK